ncbi:MAG: flagellar hook-associated protein FlgK [Lachnospiraceae bacterium]|nr:flagellar hook-associated protein FlgK [Ruminococcus sp.]MCM1276136.1 flagellar hook-associated protein FlgK [Lachnospiraceae bacterium]
MRPTFLGFETQKRTLQIAQKNLDITGNNISNINTPGYTRQRVDMYSMYVSGNRSLRWSSKTNNLSMQGQGVNAYGVIQIRDIFIDKRYRENVSIESETSTKVQILSEIEDVLDDFETDGLQYHVTQFFDALQDYSAEKPDSTEVATIVVNTAKNLCQLLNAYDKELREIETTYVTELRDSVDYINNIVADMNALNDKIAREKIHLGEGYDPNELCDQMNLYIDEMATYGNIEFDRNDDGTYNVMLGGVTILNGAEGKTNRLIMKDYDNYGLAIVQYESGHPTNFTSGTLKGFIDMLNGNGVYASGGQNSVHGIAYFKTAVDEFARTLANTFNTANGAAEDASRTMFAPAEDGALITAGNIRIADSWGLDPTMIGKVRTLDPITGLYKYGFDENKDDIKADETSELVNLQNTNVKYLISQFDSKAIKFGNCHDFEGTIYEYIAFVSDRLGLDIDYEISRNETAEVTVDGLLDARDDVSAVQMDEEGINMLNYQKWYNASSRMVTALDDLLDKLINGTGRVGL